MACNCASGTCNCVVQGGNNVTVDGAGTPGNPYVINAGATGLQANDTNSVDHTLTGTGTAADPWILTSNVIRDPAADNILTIGPDGVGVSCEAVQDCVGQALNDGLEYDDANNQINVKPSADPGNTTIISPNDGGIYTPSSPVTLGCGLEFGTFGEIQVETVDFATLTRRNADDDSDTAGTTPLAAGCETEGMPIYCDGDGLLRTKPEKFGEVGAANSNEAFAPGLTALPQNPIGNTIQLSITNPSDCYAMCGNLTMAFICGISGAPGTVINVFHEVDLGLGAGVFTAVTGFVMDNRGNSANAGHIDRPTATFPVCLDPGETKVFRYRVSAQRFTGDNGGAVLITSLAKDIRYVGNNI